MVPAGDAGAPKARGHAVRAWADAAAEVERNDRRFMGANYPSAPDANGAPSNDGPRPEIDPRFARVVHQAFFRTSFSKSQVTGPLRLIDSFTMCATAAAWWPFRPSSIEGLRVRTESKKRPTWM